MRSERLFRDVIGNITVSTARITDRNGTQLETGLVLNCGRLSPIIKIAQVYADLDDVKTAELGHKYWCGKVKADGFDFNSIHSQVENYELDFIDCMDSKIINMTK